MIEKHTFVRILDILAIHEVGMKKLEEALNLTFDNNFLTKTLDNTLVTLGQAFFTEEEVADLEMEVTINTVIDMLYHYAFKGEFGDKKAELQRLYIENENMSNELAFNAFNSSDLYDIIDRYIHPKTHVINYTINC